jgi:hypothetical protein
MENTGIIRKYSDWMQDGWWMEVQFPEDKVAKHLSVVPKSRIRGAIPLSGKYGNWTTWALKWYYMDKYIPTQRTKSKNV